MPLVFAEEKSLVEAINRQFSKVEEKMSIMNEKIDSRFRKLEHEMQIDLQEEHKFFVELRIGKKEDKMNE